MAIKFIKQDADVLPAAYNARKEEYGALRATKQWSGAISHAGILLELALKLVLCRHIGEKKLPVMYQIHDLELLRYCAGQRNNFLSNQTLQYNFDVVSSRWSIELRYKGKIYTQADADLVHQALFDSANGVLTFLSQYF